LKSLTYVSRAVRGLADTDLLAIEQISLALNAIAGITGFLVFDGVAFMQIIEGPAVPLAGLLQQLLQDKRHHDLTIVDERSISARSFGKWSMKLVKVGPDEAIELDEIESELGPSVDPEIRAMLVGTATMMRAIA
jgi:hypothetical protein